MTGRYCCTRDVSIANERTSSFHCCAASLLHTGCLQAVIVDARYTIGHIEPTKLAREHLQHLPQYFHFVRTKALLNTKEKETAVVVQQQHPPTMYRCQSMHISGAWRLFGPTLSTHYYYFHYGITPVEYLAAAVLLLCYCSLRCVCCPKNQAKKLALRVSTPSTPPAA